MSQLRVSKELFFFAVFDCDFPSWSYLWRRKVVIGDKVIIRNTRRARKILRRAGLLTTTIMCLILTACTVQTRYRICCEAGGAETCVEPVGKAEAQTWVKTPPQGDCARNTAYRTMTAEWDEEVR